ncbi:MAG: ATP-binding protein [Prevotella sp.]|nr:ATP-binding protein [Prevotella sp.]
MKENIVGREIEIEKLENYIASRKSEFIAIYGRRRVGKTFLVKELLEDMYARKVSRQETGDDLFE